MRVNYVNEIEVIYKPRLDITPLKKATSDFNIVEFLRSIWTDDIEYRERFYAIYLNRQNRILGYHLISIGGCTGTVVDKKLIFQPAFSLHATSIIVSHNHPSGNLNPSNSDLNITNELVEACKILGFEILDHIILTIDKHFSFKRNDLI